jgi:hypothetical protein
MNPVIESIFTKFCILYHDHELNTPASAAFNLSTPGICH